MKKMKKIKWVLLASFLLGIMLFGVAGCSDGKGGNPTDPDPSQQQTMIAELKDFSLGFGETIVLQAKGDNLVWSSSDEAIATVSQDGKVTAITLGEATISVTNGTQTASCKVTVIKSANVPTCTLDLTQRVITVGGKHTLIPSVTAGGSILDGVVFVYESENEAVATVSENGVITAVAFGETKILVSFTAGGYSDTVEVPVKVVEDIVFEIANKDIVLTAYEVSGGEYSKEEAIIVERLTLNGNDVNKSEVDFVAADDNIVSVENNVITAKKVGETTVTATYRSENSKVEIEITVSVVREKTVVESKGKVDATRDATASNPSAFAYIELPLDLQITDEEVLSVTDKNGEVLSENNGLTITKESLSGKEKVVHITTDELIYVLTVKIENSYIAVKNYAEQFTDPIGIRAKALVEEMDGRNDVLKTVSPTTEGTSNVWFNHCGNLVFDAYGEPWTNKGIFVFDVKAEAGTPLGGYATSSIFKLNHESKKFTIQNDAAAIKIVDGDFNETTFVYGQWNTVVIDYRNLPLDGTTRFTPSFVNEDRSSQYTAYYSNMRFMTADAYAKLVGEAAEEKYTVTFETGIPDWTVSAQKVGYRGRIDVPTAAEEYNFVGWTVEGMVVDAANLYVTEDITLTAVYDKEYNYTVKHFLRTITGAYKLQDTEIFTAKMSAVVEATPKIYSGYTFNATLSTVRGNVLAGDALVLACYYENDAYTFETQELGGHANLTITKQAMEGVTPESLRGNTYLYNKTVANGNTMNTFVYDENDVGKYLVLNLYYKQMPVQIGVNVWANTPGLPVASELIKGYYDANGKLLGDTNASSVLNRWISVVIYLDETKILPTETVFHLTLCEWSANELYYGEYTFLTEAQYKEAFETVGFDEITGAKRYAATELISKNNAVCSLTDTGNGFVNYAVTGAAAGWDSRRLQVRGVSSWAAGYVAIRVYGNDITPRVLMYGPGDVVLDGIWYDQDKNVVTEPQANTWYTVVFKITEDIASIDYAGSFLVTESKTVGDTVSIEGVYAMTEAQYKEYFKVAD